MHTRPFPSCVHNSHREETETAQEAVATDPRNPNQPSLGRKPLHVHVMTMLRDVFVPTEISTEEELSTTQADGAAFQVFLLCKCSSMNTLLLFSARAKQRHAQLPEGAKHFCRRSSLCFGPTSEGSELLYEEDRVPKQTVEGGGYLKHLLQSSRSFLWSLQKFQWNKWCLPGVGRRGKGG